MTFFYKILFSIKICVQNADSTNAVASLPSAFRIAPTQACKETLRQFGLLFKSVDGGGLIIQELVGNNIANATPKKQITEITGFYFTIQLNDKNLLNRIRPYVNNPGTGVQPSPLAPFIGRARIVYFDNLDNNANQMVETTIDSECQQQIRLDANGNPDRNASGNFQYNPVAVVPLTYLAEPTTLNTENRVGINDLASTLPNRFTYFIELPDTREVFAIHPTHTTAITPNSPDNTSELPYFDVPIGAYKLVETINGNSTEEIVFGSNELVDTNGIGIIQILKNNANTLSYEIKFKIA